MRTKNQRQINKATDIKQNKPKKVEKEGGHKTKKMKKKANKILPETRTLTTNPESSIDNFIQQSDLE